MSALDVISGWFGKRRLTHSTVPPDCRVYAIGDIHGRSDLLNSLIGLIRRDAASYSQKIILVFVGDYVDRGPDSMGVIARLLDLEREFTVHCLRGNHDQVLLDFLKNPRVYELWREFGGVETLLSYGVRPPLTSGDEALIDARDRFARALPEGHRYFLEELRLSCEIGDYFFAHAGIRPGIPLADQQPHDLMWIREEFLSSAEDFGKTVVHGHTPAGAPAVHPNRLGIDTGAYFTGRLTAAVLEGKDCRFLQTS